MGRAIGAIVAASLVWTVLWLGFSSAIQALLPELVRAGERLDHAGVLLGYIGYSALISIVAGYVCAAVRRESPMRTVWVFALIQLLIGIGVEISYWSLMPAWYHVAFLALIVPATVWGGSLRAGRTTAAPA